MSDYIQSGFVIVPGLVKKFLIVAGLPLANPYFVDQVFIVVACVDFET